MLDRVMSMLTDNGKERMADDAFFMERLEMLCEQGLEEKLRTFAERENRPIEQIKRHVAELHCKSLFTPSLAASSSTDRSNLISQVLQTVSQQLESLERLAGLQSFFLVVDPHDENEQGFLGGTIAGREFWRGHRGCGAPGALLFKAQCARSVQGHPCRLATTAGTPPPPAATPSTTLEAQAKKKGAARVLKTELYGAMRDALRAASGVRNAEMKWTNHAKLDVYGVHLVGWPEGVPQQNPSTLSVAHNQLVLDQLNEGKLFFSRLDGALVPCPKADVEEGEQKDADIMFEDSIDYSWLSEETESTPAAAQGPRQEGNLEADYVASSDGVGVRAGGPARDSVHGISISRTPTPKRRRTDEV